MEKIKTIILIFTLLLFSSFGDEKTLTLEIRYTHPIEINYWNRLNDDLEFKSLYNLIMIKDTLDKLLVKDIHQNVIGTIEGRPSSNYLVDLYYENLKN